ncbi:MAG: hypothetical protein LBE15_00695 [Burkholderiales bacterium]|jgi:uncharacterized Zn finger protein|nr:hypothetical protein [Burkholderiales bacterium]
MSYWGWGFPPYISVAQRRAKADKQAARLKKQGRVLSPVVTGGRKIAKSFWGKAWCDNLERYSDFDNRLPRGRSYVNGGLVIDLQLERGKVKALVSGSEVYRVEISIDVASPKRWKAICADCSGSVGSIVELLQGKLSKNVMERVCRPDDGLFPAPREIKMSCSCPDWAEMCKHVAATLYGVGARLDHEPDLLFTLRGVDRGELVSAGTDLSITEVAADSERVLADADVAALFGLAIESASPKVIKPVVKKKVAKKMVAKKVPAKKLAKKKVAGASVLVTSLKKSAVKTVTATEPALPKVKKSGAKKVSAKKSAKPKQMNTSVVTDAAKKGAMKTTAASKLPAGRKPVAKVATVKVKKTQTPKSASKVGRTPPIEAQKK